MADIKSGEEILDYVKQIKVIIVTLQEAYTKLQKIDNTICGSNNYYEGNAKEEIHTYCQSQSTHLQKIMGFYSKGAQYAEQYFSQMEFTDEELTKIIISLF